MKVKKQETIFKICAVAEHFWKSVDNFVLHPAKYKFDGTRME